MAYISENMSVLGTFYALTVMVLHKKSIEFKCELKIFFTGLGLFTEVTFSFTLFSFLDMPCR